MSCPTYYLGKLYVIYIIALLFDYILLCKLSKTILNVFYMINKNSINFILNFNNDFYNATNRKINNTFFVKKVYIKIAFQ